jgi:hypothetical protein
MTLNKIATPAIVLVAVSLVALPAHADQGAGKGAPERGTAVTRVAPRADVPQSNGVQAGGRDLGAAMPKGQIEAPVTGPGRSVPEQYGTSARGGTSGASGASGVARAVPRQGTVTQPGTRGTTQGQNAEARPGARETYPRQGSSNGGAPGAYRGQPYEGRGGMDRGGFGMSRHAPPAPAHFLERPYYAFRPRLNLRFGLWIGYGVPYPLDAFRYTAYYRTYGYGGYGYRDYGYAGQPYANAAYGGLSFEITPPNAEVYVDGVYAGLVGEFTPNAPPLTLAAGLHRIELQAWGYEGWAFEVNVMPGQVMPFQGSLQYAQPY